MLTVRSVVDLDFWGELELTVCSVRAWKSDFLSAHWAVSFEIMAER